MLGMTQFSFNETMAGNSSSSKIASSPPKTFSQAARVISFFAEKSFI
jgi:hypothetical protein